MVFVGFGGLFIVSVQVIPHSMKLMQEVCMLCLTLCGRVEIFAYSDYNNIDIVRNDNILWDFYFYF